MRQIYVLLALLFTTVITTAQTHKQSGSLQNTLTAVIRDFPEHFSHIKGDLLEQVGQELVYASSAFVPGTNGATITQFGAPEEHELSWKNILSEEADFKKATASFQKYYSELSKLHVNVTGTNVHFKAAYSTPEEIRKFTTIQFTTEESAMFEDVVLDLSLQYMAGLWQISVSMYKLVSLE